jgi:hypothetical protein
MSMGTITWMCLLLTANAGEPEAWHLNHRGFQIPIRIKPESRPEIRELLLYVSKDQGQTWELQQRLSPEKEAFPFFAPSDGPFWFSVAVVDRNGKQDPPDPYTAKIHQRIIIDTVKPDMKFTAAERKGEEIQVQWTIREDHPDTPTLKLEYRAADANPASPWVPVGIMPGDHGQVTIRPGTQAAVSLRLHLKDLAGNEGLAQAEVAAGVPATQVGGGLSLVGAPTATPGIEKPVNPPPLIQPALIQPVVNPSPRPLTADPPPPDPTPLGTGLPMVRPARVETPSQVMPPANTAIPPVTRGALPPLRIVNKRQVKLDFEVAKFGPSGLGSVDVYMTVDEGATWEKSPADPSVSLPVSSEIRGAAPVRGSVTVHMNKEGITYGFHVVVKSRAGLGKPPPQPGDPPQIRMEVDTTLPEAELYSPQADPNRRDTLVLSWKAKDRNLAANPVSLEWSERKEGPWQFIGAAELPNTGRYSWQVPETIPPKVYLKLSVRDTAGNTAVAQTSEPILVDLSIPEVNIIGLGNNSR